MATDPRVSVLMPVFNGEPYLRQSMESILNQSYSNFEFIIINDGSQDQSRNIISSYNDPRIRLIDQPENLGYGLALNRGIDQAQGEYIARMDCDDISLPERLAKQIIFMDSHPEVGVCGGWIQYFEGSDVIISQPTVDSEIKKEFLAFCCPLSHPTIMMRTSLIKMHHLYYDPAYQPAEDYDLWVRILPLTCFANLAEILVMYRIHPNQVTSRKGVELSNAIQKIQERIKNM
jgi:glycosyltransferase involved in cell wall biosynthesis